MTDNELTSEPSDANGMLPRAALFMSVLAFAAMGIRTLSSYTIWFHMACGRWMAGNGPPRTDPFSFTLDGARWVNDSWLYDLLVYALWQLGHAPLLILFHIACAVLALALFVGVARRHDAGYAGIAFAILLAAWLISPRFFPTPALAALIFPAVFLWTFTAGKRLGWLYMTLVPAQILWANVHSSYILGPLLCFGFMYQAYQQPERGHVAPFDKMFLLAVTLVVASTVNPQGLYLHGHTLTMWTSNVGHYTHEWISPYYALFGSSFTKNLITVSYVLGAAGLLTYRSKLPSVIAGAAILLAIFVMLSNRHLELFALLSLPFIAMSLTSVHQFTLDRLGWSRAITQTTWLATALIGSLLTIGVLLSDTFYVRSGSVSRFGLQLEQDVYPDGAANMVQQEGFPERSVHLAMDAGYLQWNDPTFNVFIDPRAAHYGDSFFHVTSELLTGSTQAQSMVEAKWDTEATIVNCLWPSSGRAVRALTESGQWALSYFDGISAVLIRSVSEYSDLLNDKERQSKGIELIRACADRYHKRLQSTFPPPPPARLVGAATVFMALDRHREAAELYALLLRGAPNMIGARMSFGVCQIRLGKAEEGLRQLQIVLHHYPKDVNVWLWLGQAYADTGDIQAAKEAYVRAAELNPTAAMNFGHPLDRQ